MMSRNAAFAAAILCILILIAIPLKAQLTFARAAEPPPILPAPTPPPPLRHPLDQPLHSLPVVRMYQDLEYGFSVEYPSMDWRQTIAFENSATMPEHVIRRQVCFEGPAGARINIDVWDRLSDSGLEHWFAQVQLPLLLDPPEAAHEPNMVIKGRPGFFTVQPPTSQAPARLACLFQDGARVFRVEYWALDGGDAEAVYRAMLHTFGFGPHIEGASAETTLPTISPEELSPRFVLADSSCCGYSASGNPYPCGCGGGCGNCTWWAWYKRASIGDPLPTSSWGNAHEWDTRAAQSGFTVVEGPPQEGAIIVLEPGEQGAHGTLGHVAYVEQKESETQCRVSDMWYQDVNLNCGCEGVCCRVCTWYHYNTNGSRVHFIYRKTCSAPSLDSPNDDYVHTSSDRTITFSWSPPSDCTPDGYTFRVKTVPDMESGGTTIFDEGQGGTQVTKQFGSEWDNTDLYWSVRACKPCTPFNPGSWAPSRRFRIEPIPDTHLECSDNWCVRVGGAGSDQCSPEGSWCGSCNPNADQVALFAETNYSGMCVVLGVGEYREPDQLNPVGNDNTRSIKVGADVQATLYEHSQFGGHAELFTSDDPDLGNNGIGYRTSSVNVEWKPRDPDLRPYAPPGYPYPVVPSSRQGTHSVDTLYADARTFFDWHFINSGDGTASGSFYVDLLVDGEPIVHYPYSDLDSGQYRGFDDWATTIATAGVHTVRLVVDPENTVAESDEGNNIWEGQFTWQQISAWRGEYWNNRELSGNPWLTRDDFALDFDWGTGPPDAALDGEKFSARWDRTLDFAEGDYRFHMMHDDGARLFVDGASVIDAWDTCCSWRTADVSLTAGDHSVRMEMHEDGGAASAILWWERLDISGWRGEYYNNEELTGHPVVVRDDGPAIDFEWTDQSPDPLVQRDHFSARWTRSVPFDGGTYRFRVFRDDGARLWIDEDNVLDEWHYGREEHVVTHTLTSGDHSIRMEMYEIDGWAAAKLSWEKLGTIYVTTNRADASWNITGPASYSGTGNETITNAPAGTYGITWGDLPNCTTPASETKSLSAGGAITFEGNYSCGMVGPLEYESYVADDDNSGDSNGNNDGIVNCGEIIELWVDLRNQGTDTATGVNATISTSDPFVTFPYNTSSDYPDIPGAGTGTNGNDFDFAVDASTPDGHIITFELDITGSNGGPWSDFFDVRVTCISNNPPYTPGSPSPADGGTDVPITTDLSWTGGDPDPGDTVTYDVYFEANDSTPEDLICNDVSASVCDPGTLLHNSHYYWYVVATDSHGVSTTGSTWGFTTTVGGDAYEPDDTWDQASWIYDGSPQAHSIVPVGDVDWIKFSLDEECEVVLETSGPSGDTGMWLYDSDLNELEYNNDGGSDLFSRIDRLCGTDALPVGTYYVKVDEYGNNHEIPTYNTAFMVVQSCAATLPVPTGLHLMAASDVHIDLAWADNSDESDFHIERSSNGSTGWMEIGTVGADVTSYSDTGLSAATTYYYRVRAHRHSDNQYSGYSNVASGTTLGIVEPPPTVNNPPYAPSNPSPADGATGQNLNVDLSWSGGDPDGDAVTYDVFLAANGSSSDAPVCDDVTDTSCDPGTLSYDTHYSWWVIARDEHGATRTGPMWDFTTRTPTIGMIETGNYHSPRDRLVGLGYSVTLIPVSAEITTFRQYDIVYLPVQWASTSAGNYSEIESHAEDYRAYVSEGGGLSVDQPNPFGQPDESVSPSLLPYPMTFYNPFNSGDWPPTIVDPNHYITRGLSPSDMPGPNDQITAIDPTYDVLVRGQVTSSPSLVVGEHGQGRIVVQTGHPEEGFSDEVYRRMIEWVASDV